MSGAVPCLSTDLTTHAVPHFIPASEMGMRTAPKALNDSCDERGKPEASHARASAVARGKTKRTVTAAAHIVAIHKLRALREYHVQCSSLTPAGVV